MYNYIIQTKKGDSKKLVTKKIKMVVFDIVTETDGIPSVKVIHDVAIIGNSKKMAYDNEIINEYKDRGERCFPVNIRIENRKYCCDEETFLTVATQIKENESEEN